MNTESEEIRSLDDITERLDQAKARSDAAAQRLQEAAQMLQAALKDACVTTPRSSVRHPWLFTLQTLLFAELVFWGLLFALRALIH